MMQRTAFIFGLGLLLSACGDASVAPVQKACTGLSDDKMVWVPGGSFVMGDDPHYPEEGPPRTVSVKGFWIDAHEVTNAQFAAFVKATGYKTMSERDPPKLPGAPPEMLVPGSAVFNIPSDDDPRWWRWVVGAQWRNPSGPKESIVGRDNEPVVQIAYQDAEAYARAIYGELHRCDEAGAELIITAYAPVGPVADLFAKFAPRLEQEGVPLVQIRRSWDEKFWPHATKGFFPFKEKIPKILGEIGSKDSLQFALELHSRSAS